MFKRHCSEAQVLALLEYRTLKTYATIHLWQQLLTLPLTVTQRTVTLHINIQALLDQLDNQEISLQNNWNAWQTCPVQQVPVADINSAMVGVSFLFPEPLCLVCS